jgi:hypothetical protein
MGWEGVVCITANSKRNQPWELKNDGRLVVVLSQVMNHLLKLLLTIGFFLAASYAATPLWLPYVFALQLPPGWQLEKLEAGYPGISSTSIAMVRVTGELMAGGLELTAANLRYHYGAAKLDIGSASLDLFLLAGDDKNSDALTLDDLSLPITSLTGKTPDLSITELQITVHPVSSKQPMSSTPTQPLELNFQAFKLNPINDDQFHLSTTASSEAFPEIVGQLDVDVGTDSRKARLFFRADGDLEPWLGITLEQTDRADKTTTRLIAKLDAQSKHQQWLDVLSTQLSAGFLTQLSGKLGVQAEFSGADVQDIESFSVIAEQLRAKTTYGTLLMDSAMHVNREGGKITMLLPVPTEIAYQDDATNIDKLLIHALPELKRSAQPFEMARAVLGAGSSFVIQTDPESSFSFSGDIDVDLVSAQSNIHLNSTGLQIEADDLSELESVSSQGSLTLDWVEQSPFAYISDELELKADHLSLSSSGHFLYHDLTADFDQSGLLELLNPVIKLSNDPQTPATTINAKQLSIDAALSSTDGVFLSTGGSVFLDANVSLQNTSVDSLELGWQGLDLLNPSGQFTTRTRGFSTEVDAETFTGFDFDLRYSLLSNSDTDGSGTVLFDGGLTMPIEFNGNANASLWNITLPTSTIEIEQLGELLAVAHFDLPDFLKLTDGSIDIQGDIMAGDEITANLLVKGSEIVASLLESKVRQVSFTFNTSYENSISAKGPVSISIVELAGGVDVADVRLELNLHNPEKFSLDNLHAEVFDGQISLDKLQFSGNNIEKTIVAMDNINLGRLLAFADVNGLSGSGNLQMSLPLESNQSGAHIKNGTFQSMGPGHLVYKPGGVAGGNIGLQALENFHYQNLSGVINYQSAGAYMINLRLEGKNPDLYGGYPIVFNLNLDGSLPEFFEAMFITGSFEEAILKQVKGHQLE